MSPGKNKIKWALLCTGWGRNARDLISAQSDGVFTQSEISLIIYESLPCGAAEAAHRCGIDHIRIARKDYPDPITYQKELIKEISLRKIDYIFLLGYKYLIREEMLAAFPGRIINIHPSLFPSFLGTKTAIQDAINYGVKVSGITTHIIDEKFDRGTILYQVPIKINSKDTFESLYPKFSKKGLRLIIKTIKHFERDT